ncbi:short chain dehydrogenase [uncultured archaeon]|nr:short chain dehydrogenase [uncultured archaeon]
MGMGKVLLITGAGGGLGSLVAASEAKNYGEIALLDRDGGRLSSAAKKVRSSGGASPHMLQADVSDMAQLERALSQFTSIDGLVNAAGVLGPVERFGDGSWDDWVRAVSVNFVGNAAVCRAALPALLNSRRGKIVNFAGGGSAGVRPHHSAYASSKAAMVRFTEILAAECPGMDANIIAPGAHRTGIWDGETHDKPPEKWADKGRFLSLVSFLLSGKSDGISGKFIHINDEWEKFTPQINRSDMYTLRRREPARQ